jgi:hypothetical protein
MDAELVSAAAAESHGPREDVRPRLRRRIGSHPLRKYTELKLEHQRLRRRFAVTCAALVALAAGFGGWALHATHAKRELATANFRQRASLAEAKAAAQRAEEELAALVQGRIPNLQPLVLDQVIPVGRDFVKNIAFAQLREDGVPSTEFKLLLQNDAELMAIPRVRLLIFDRLGVEIARAQVGANQGAASQEEEILYPGTTRSYGGTFALARDAEPAYFLLDSSNAAL